MNTRTATLASLILFLGALPSLAAGPFVVRRAGAPADVASAPALAWSASATWDDVTDDLADGLDWYYLVEDASGGAVTLWLAKNPDLRCVRLIALAPPTPLTQREAAVETLGAIGSPDGAIASIAESSDSWVAALLLDAQADLSSAAATLADPDGGRDNLALKRDLDQALRDLLDARAIATTEAGAIEALIDVLLAEARAIAVHHVTAAETLCGSAIAEAASAIAEGDAAREAGDPSGAVDAWARAIERSWQAASHCD